MIIPLNLEQLKSNFRKLFGTRSSSGLVRSGGICRQGWPSEIVRP